MGIVRIWRRDLFQPERRVSLKILEEQWDTAEKDFVDAASPILSQMLERLLSDVKVILEEKNYTALKDIQIGYRGKLVNALKQQLLNAFKFGKGQAHSEFSITSEVTVSTRDKQYLTAKAEAITTNIFDRVRSTAIFVVLAGVRAGKTIEQILFDVKGEAYKGDLSHA